MLNELSGAKWSKSRRSSAGSDCVEVAHLRQGRVAVRDSKNPAGPAFVFTPRQWDAFLSSTRAGEFDHP